MVFFFFSCIERNVIQMRKQKENFVDGSCNVRRAEVEPSAGKS